MKSWLMFLLVVTAFASKVSAQTRPIEAVRPGDASGNISRRVVICDVQQASATTTQNKSFTFLYVADSAGSKWVLINPNPIGIWRLSVANVIFRILPSRQILPSALWDIRPSQGHEWPISADGVAQYPIVWKNNLPPTDKARWKSYCD